MVDQTTSLDVAASTSLSSSETMDSFLPGIGTMSTSYSNDFDRLTYITTDMILSTTQSSKSEKDVEKSYDASNNACVGGTTNKDISNLTESTDGDLIAEEKKVDISPTYLPNLVAEDSFSGGLPPPPILMETRIGSETSAFSSVSGLVHRPIASRPSPTPTSDCSASMSPSPLDFTQKVPENKDVQPTQRPSPTQSRSSGDDLNANSEENTSFDAVSLSSTKSGPQRRLQLFEKASRIASLARRHKAGIHGNSDGQQSGQEKSASEENSETFPNSAVVTRKGDVATIRVEPDLKTISTASTMSSSPPRETKVTVVENRTQPLHSMQPKRRTVPLKEVPESEFQQSLKVKETAPDREPAASVTPAMQGASTSSFFKTEAELSRAPSEIKEKYLRASPLARMRSDRAQEAAAMSPEAIAEAEKAAMTVLAYHTDEKSEKEMVEETHRRWRRSLQHAKRKQRRHLDGDSVVDEEISPLEQAACDRDGKLLSLLKYELSNLIKTGCGAMEDIVDSFEGSYDEDDSFVSEDSFFTDDDTMDRSRSRGRSRTRRQLHRPVSKSRRHSSRRSPSTEADISQASSRDDDDSEYCRSVERGYRDSQKKTPKSKSKKTPPTTKPRKISPEKKKQSSPVRKNSIKINDKNFIKAFIEELCKFGMTFTWHQAADVLSNFSGPVKVKMQLKMGEAKPDGTYDGPRLIWNEKNEKMSVENGGVDLFEIKSVERATDKQTKSSPSMDRRNSLIVRNTEGKDYVFEASSSEEARRFIHGLRWLVARLAFNLIIGNRDVSCELVRLISESEEATAQETRHSKAMNDVTDHLVEKIVYL